MVNQVNSYNEKLLLWLVNHVKTIVLLGPVGNLPTIFVSLTQYPVGSNLREEGFMFPHGLEMDAALHGGEDMVVTGA